MAEFKTDENGQVILNPLTGWELHHIAGMLMILAIDYAENQDELEKGVTRRLPLVVSPALALDLAVALQRSASKLLAEAPPNSSVH